MEPLAIVDDNKVLDVQRSLIDNSKFYMVCLTHAEFKDVNMSNCKITDANLSDLEIEGAQLGGAYIHNIGMPPECHPMYDADAKQRPLRFENCELSGSTITNCNLSGVDISNCNISGLKINGILIEDLLKK
ncbi:pentapeptide repeat-containing protein [Mucilaginibacter agri]|uniref:Pentapeptide repeat-containing protein n=1 Tax=Mucilaginibacter agri TaxID=2695265 RepID=A0A965ZK16_9SPHI|nr:pentapeptide repeat-containing protein [Mucilaginibacter agri]NCD71076.1 pentapeptide repeat-containing protein [Mucilaginibacter agri]